MNNRSFQLSKHKLFDLYTDYLISSTGLATSVGLSNILNKEISHDKITRFLSSEEFKSKDLWKMVKKKVREIETEDGINHSKKVFVKSRYTLYFNSEETFKTKET